MIKQTRGIWLIATLVGLLAACNVSGTPKLEDAPLETTAVALDWPITGTVTSNIGSRWGRMHNGIDIGARYGTSVYAALGGTVITSENPHSDAGPNLIEIRHNNGYVTRYHHLSARSVSVGARVSQGQLIGRSGTAGTGPHLHFEVRRGPSNITDGFQGKVIDFDNSIPVGRKLKAKTTLPFDFPGLSGSPGSACTWLTVKEGSRGRRVEQVQYFLKSYVNAKLEVDGKFGPNTTKAVRSFQYRNGLAVDGVVGPDTWSKLTPTIRYGSGGNAVRAVQVRLGLKEDGKFGPATLAGVKELQKRNGLTADGVVGPNTWPAVVFGTGCK